MGDPSEDFLSSGVFYPQVVDQTSSWLTSLEFFPPLTSSKVVEGALMVSFIGNLVRNVVNDHARQCLKFRRISSSLE